MATLFSQLLEGIGASPRATATSNATRAASPDSVLSVITVEDINAPQSSSSSTPPTSIGDHASISSTSLKLEGIEATPSVSAPPSTGRSRRNRASVATYNIKVLTGTAVHAPHKFDINAKTGLPAAHAKDRRRTVSGDTLVGLASNNSSTETVQRNANRLVRDAISTLDLKWSPKALPKSRSQIGLGGSSKKSAKQQEAARRATRASGEKIESLTKKISVLGKRRRKTFEEGLGGLTRAARELKRLADTNEFAGIETKPVIHEVWSNGKLVVPESPRKKRKAEEAAKKKAEKESEKEPERAEEKKPEKKSSGKRVKVWLNKGLYAGQTQNFNWFKDSSGQTQKDMADIAPYKPNSFMPLPMWHGQRLLHVGRDFKLPFDVCSPLPPGQPKPDEWRKTSSSMYALLETVDMH
jgi:histone-lysine N-methyltransferase ASH1L